MIVWGVLRWRVECIWSFLLLFCWRLSYGRFSLLLTGDGRVEFNRCLESCRVHPIFMVNHGPTGMNPGNQGIEQTLKCFGGVSCPTASGFTMRCPQAQASYCKVFGWS